MTTEAEWWAFFAGVLCGLFVSLWIIIQLRTRQVQFPSCTCPDHIERPPQRSNQMDEAEERHRVVCSEHDDDADYHYAGEHEWCKGPERGV